MKEKLKILILSILFMILLVPSVNAKIDDNFIADNNVIVNENKDSSIFVAGNSLTIENEVRGVTFGAGNNVNVKGSGEYSFIAGNSVNINDYQIRDVFVAGNIITINNINVERESYIVGSQISINGNLGRSTYIAGGNIIIDGNYNGGLTVDASKIVVKSGAVVTGTFKYNKDANITFEDGCSVDKRETYDNPEIDKEGLFVVTTGTMIISKIISIINLIIIGIVLVLILPALFNKVDKIEKTGGVALKEAAIGLIALICIPFTSLILLFTGVASVLGLIALVIYTMMIYLSTVFTGYYLVNAIWGKKTNRYLAVILGTLLISIIKLVPIVGSLVSFISVVLGLGIMISSVFYKKR